MCAAHALLPKSLKAESCYDPASIPHRRGGFADVWKGKHLGREVAVKVLRVYVNTDLPKMTRVSYEYRTRDFFDLSLQERLL